MHFIPLGVGDAFSARWYSSCVAIESEGAWILIDCPHPIRKMMREAGEAAKVTLDVDKIAAVIVTHLHADHASGLEGFAYFSTFVLQKQAVIAAHPEVLLRLWDGHLAAGMEQLVPGPDQPPRKTGFHHFFEAKTLSESGPVKIGPFEIECRPTKHHIATTALRIKAGKRSLAYSADTAYDPKLIEWLSAADVILHETNYGPAHTPYERLAGLPEGLRAKMRLIHYPDQFDPRGSAIECLEQGKWYRV